ncbi:oxidoreductase, short chain dehydrogenase/reductase family protein [Tritrichomonas foetus]|uniref:Oxidoreductase, short chain dehydrogenase/reductase family protein n=1 Tax=Tritrichomonas foetus TaxID=1144522 RepID=A0A1J4KH84_9EUKA|nr:oxidoreductase, short chain dehydrogenase/reductase family protein [Tritrichomonas foetus]|eukprot:OHT10713.1 oxidoreductase, short chain dehydrogenase/reductase family protein [Tritrichomonas foetus]
MGYFRQISRNEAKMLKGKNCVIIGATSDIGEAISLKFSQLEANILLIHGRNQANLSKIENDIISNGVKCKSFSGDLCNSEQINQLKDKIEETIKNDQILIDIFVFCPGCCGEMDPVGFIRMETDFLRVMQLNFTSCVDLFESFIPFFSSQSSAVFITSTNTFIPMECGSAYCSSKAALKEYMKNKAIELGPKGIRVNTVAPGLVETKFHNQYFESKEDFNAFFEKAKNEHPLGRIATSNGVANSVMFLCSDLSSEITGTELVIDCGESLSIPKIKNEESEEEEEEESN